MMRFKLGANIARLVMTTFAAVAMLLAGQPLSAQDATSFQDYPQTTLSGLVTAQVPVTEARCRKICTERAGCVGFDHSATTNQCRLFGGIASAKADTSSTASTRYPVPGYRQPVNRAPPPEPVAQEPPQQAPRNFRYYANSDVFGYDLAQFQTNSMARCESACRGDSQCKAFTFNEWNQKCFLKSGTSNLRLEPRARTGVLVSERQPGFSNAPISMEYYREYTITGSQIGGSRQAASRDRCERMCWNDDECVAFSFVRGQGQCRLYDEASNRFPKNGVESGAKIQPRP